MKVWLYYRLSRDEDEELNSLNNQRQIIYNIALSNFGELVPDQLRGTKNDFKSNTWQVQVAYLF